MSSEDPLALFTIGVRVALQNWDVLQAAVESQWGGHYSQEKAEWLETVVVDMFKKGTHEAPRAQLFLLLLLTDPKPPTPTQRNRICR